MGGISRFEALLRQKLGGLVGLSDEQVSLLNAHFHLAERWNRVLNLTAVRDVAQAVVRHYCESLFLATHLPAGPARILDVGSGAGFPGVPVAVARPECLIVLAEARHRKAAFLREATRGWGNVRVHFGRAEDLGERFDWVVSRAVRPEAVLRIAARLGDCIGLLVGERGASDMTGPDHGAFGAAGWGMMPGEVRTKGGREPIVRWDARLKLPWGERRLLLLGRVVAKDA